MIREGAIISGRYEVLGRIGTGGMADVYKAMDQKLNRYVAMKVLKSEFREDESFVEKFKTEAQSAAGLQHPNIVSVYDVGEDRGRDYIVMEFIDGITLKEYIDKKGNLTPKEVISIAIQVCSAMEMAHGNKLVHRDIKPQNIMISKEGKVKVTDFGIAKATSSNTISTNMMGSVHYTSPEQARGGFSDAKSDIYSLGISMYEMITGELPFDGDSTVSIALQHLQDDITPPSDIVPDIPYSLERIILKCTQKSPDRRYANIMQLERDLRKSLKDPDGDFVVIAPLQNISGTRRITEDEFEKIRESAVVGYDMDEDDDDDYEARRARRRESRQKGVDPRMATINRVLTIVVTVIAVFILGVVVWSTIDGFNFGFGDEATTNRKVPVPDLVGKSLDEAEELCEEAGIRINVESKVASKKYEKDVVEAQRTQAGTKVPEGTIVQVVLSKGKLIEIPNLENNDFMEARDTLIDAGFLRGNIKLVEEPDETVEEDLVIRTEPEAGEFVTADEIITIYVSTGIEMVEVPNLVGMTKSEAAQLLEELGFVGEVTEEYDFATKGEVISQEEYYGTELAKGSTIHYVVSKGEEPKEKVRIPTDLTGRSYYEVKATLENMGLIVMKISAQSYEYDADQVIAVPQSGFKVEVGTVVEVHVSTGPGPAGIPAEDVPSEPETPETPETTE